MPDSQPNHQPAQIHMAIKDAFEAGGYQVSIYSEHWLRDLPMTVQEYAATREGARYTDLREVRLAVLIRGMATSEILFQVGPPAQLVLTGGSKPKVLEHVNIATLKLMRELVDSRANDRMLGILGGIL